MSFTFVFVIRFRRLIIIRRTEVINEIMLNVLIESVNLLLLPSLICLLLLGLEILDDLSGRTLPLVCQGTEQFVHQSGPLLLLLLDLMLQRLVHLFALFSYQTLLV